MVKALIPAKLFIHAIASDAPAPCQPFERPRGYERGDELLLQHGTVMCNQAVGSSR